MAAFAASAFAQQNDSCSALMNVKVPSLEITKATHVEAGSTEAIPWNQSRSAPLPAYCRIEGVINRRSGVDAEEFGINFVLAMPDKWNTTFSIRKMMLEKLQWTVGQRLSKL
jgi:feruloyl esterase